MKKLIIIVCIAWLASCAPATEITGSWKNPNEKTNKFGSVIVTAMSKNLKARETVENDLAAALSAYGVRTLKGLEVMPPGFLDKNEIDKEALLDKIRKTKAKGILIVNLINRETETRYVPGTYGYRPVTRFGYYGRFSGYYTTWYPTVYSEGYYREDKVYFIEINFYDAISEDLLWSAQSETYNPNGLEKFSKEFADVIVSKMNEDGVLIAWDISKPKVSG